MRFTAETRGVLEMQNFTPTYIKGVDLRTYGRSSEPKFLGCIDERIFLPMVLRCARKRESCAKISVI